MHYTRDLVERFSFLLELAGAPLQAAPASGSSSAAASRPAAAPAESAAPILLGLLILRLVLVWTLLGMQIGGQISNLTLVLHDGTLFSLRSSDNFNLSLLCICDLGTKSQILAR